MLTVEPWLECDKRTRLNFLMLPFYLKQQKLTKSHGRKGQSRRAKINLGKKLLIKIVQIMKTIK